MITLERLQRGHLRDLECRHPEYRRSYQMVFGDPLRWVSIRLGHASIETTLKYLHTLAELELETKLALVPDDGEWEPLELHGRDRKGVPPITLVLVHGQSADAPSVAPRAGAKEVDLPAEVFRR